MLWSHSLYKRINFNFPFAVSHTENRIILEHSSRYKPTHPLIAFNSECKITDHTNGNEQIRKTVIEYMICNVMFLQWSWWDVKCFNCVEIFRGYLSCILFLHQLPRQKEIWERSYALEFSLPKYLNCICFSNSKATAVID